MDITSDAVLVGRIACSAYLAFQVGGLVATLSLMNAGAQGVARIVCPGRFLHTAAKEVTASTGAMGLFYNLIEAGANDMVSVLVPFGLAIVRPARRVLGLAGDAVRALRLGDHFGVLDSVVQTAKKVVSSAGRFLSWIGGLFQAPVASAV